MCDICMGFGCWVLGKGLRCWVLGCWEYSVGFFFISEIHLPAKIVPHLPITVDKGIFVSCFLIVILYHSYLLIAFILCMHVDLSVVMVVLTKCYNH